MLAWCVAERPADALRFAAALVLFWFNRSLYRDGLHWLEQVLAGTDDATAARASALWGAGFLWTLVGDAERGASRLEEGLALARRLDDGPIVARALLEESAETARLAGDRWALADAFGTLGSIYPLQGEFDLAEAAGE